MSGSPVRPSKWRLRYYCDPRQRGAPPWCSGLPCPGHAASKDLVMIARIIAYLDGEDRQDIWWDPRSREDARAYLVRARLAQYAALGKGHAA